MGAACGKAEWRKAVERTLCQQLHTSIAGSCLKTCEGCHDAGARRVAQSCSEGQEEGKQDMDPGLSESDQPESIQGQQS